MCNVFKVRCATCFICWLLICRSVARPHLIYCNYLVVSLTVHVLYHNDLLWYCYWEQFVMETFSKYPNKSSTQNLQAEQTIVNHCSHWMNRYLLAAEFVTRVAQNYSQLTTAVIWCVTDCSRDSEPLLWWHRFIWAQMYVSDEKLCTTAVMLHQWTGSSYTGQHPLPTTYAWPVSSMEDVSDSFLDLLRLQAGLLWDTEPNDLCRW